MIEDASLFSCICRLGKANHGKSLGCWAQTQALSFRQFQVISGGLKPHADLQAFQFRSACVHSSEMWPTLGMFDPFHSCFFGPLKLLGSVPGLSDAQRCRCKADPSNVRAEQSWLEDEGVLMDRTARETASI